MSKKKKQILRSCMIALGAIALVTAISAGIVYYVFVTGRREICRNINNYEYRLSLVTQEDMPCVMPQIAELPEYISIDYCFMSRITPLVTPQTIRLVITYEESIFIAERERILGERVFLDRVIRETQRVGDSLSYTERYVVPEYKFSVMCFNFRVLDNRYYGGHFSGAPLRIGLIGFSEERNAVAYLQFHDFNSNVITGTMEEFVHRNFR
jgi:hypothetical protein